MFGGNFPPRGNAFCNGQLMAIAQNTALFSILGVNYGGNGQTTFGLPNLQGSAAIGAGQGPGLSNRYLGEVGGAPNVTLQMGQMATHSHSANADGASGNSPSPSGAIWSASGVGRTPDVAYASSANTSMNQNSISPVGGNQPHNNMPPYQAISFIIALEGIFPPRN
jgi:microcystin-dependent protein